MKEQRTKIFQQDMESCHSNNPIDCIEWFAVRIADLEAENEQIKNSDTLCKLIGEQKRKITELEQQIEKMKKYIKACWVEENLNDYSSYITNSSDEFRDLVKELNAEVRNGR